MKKLLGLLSGLILLAACGNNVSTEVTTNDTATAKTDAVVPKVDTVAVQVSTETYSGILPCADCQGIETSIGLTSDGTFSKHLLYGQKKQRSRQQRILDNGQLDVTWYGYSSFNRCEEGAIHVHQNRLVVDTTGYEWKKDYGKAGGEV